MKIRSIIVIFALLTFTTVAASGYLYYSSMKKSALRELHASHDASIIDMAGRIDLAHSSGRKIAAALAGMRESRDVLGTNKTSLFLAQANEVLDTFQNRFKADVCYLINRSGRVIASTNRAYSDSFVGKDYFFRPYFQSAMKGEPTVYLALGVTSGKRGAYYSHHIHISGQKEPAGVAVVKMSLDAIENEINIPRDGVIVMTDQQGVIFASTRSDWLYHTLWKTTPELLARVAASKQFGTGPFEWTGIVKTDESHVVNPSGITYIIHRAPIVSTPGWEVIYLHDTAVIADQLSGMLFRTWGSGILLACASIGFSILVLYRMGSEEINKRKRIEDELKSTSDSLQAMIQASPLPITIIGRDKRVQVWNSAAVLIFGWQEQEVIGQPLPIIPKDKEAEYATLHGKVLAGDAFRAFETRRQRKDGQEIDVALSTAPIRSPGGEVIASMAIYEDISERKRADEEIRFLAAIVQNLPDPVCAIDARGMTVAWNTSAAKLLGYSADEMLGQPLTKVIPEEIAQAEMEHCLNVLNAEGFFSGYETVRLSKDGRYIPVDVTAVTIRDKEQKIQNYASIMVDITERKKSDEERMKMHTLESIGILAGGIAHDFNNLLCSIVGNIEVAKLAMPEDGKAFARLTDAETGCDKAQELSKRLITFATGGEPLRKVMRINGLIIEAVTEAMKEAPLKVTFDLPEDLQTVAIDASQMAQVFKNLALNAREAMPGGGSFSVLGENIIASEGKVGFLVPDMHYVRIIVQDTGCGIPPENMSKIFDPYFSTKQTYSQKGLGLGLAVCYSTIARHDGFISASSVMGEGTTFTIHLPAVVRS